MKAVFPSCAIQLCFFHLTQSAGRHINQSGLKKRYENDTMFALGVCSIRCHVCLVSYILQIKMVIATAFARPDDVPLYFDAVAATLGEDADEFLDYFQSTYIGIMRRDRRTTPTFKIHDWNCHQAVVKESAKTNNALEGINRRLSTVFENTSRDLWRFLQVRTTFYS